MLLGEQMEDKEIHDRDVQMLQQSDGMCHYLHIGSITQHVRVVS